jgi:hypothetical protein
MNLETDKVKDRGIRLRTTQGKEMSIIMGELQTRAVLPLWVSGLACEALPQMSSSSISGPAIA